LRKFPSWTSPGGLENADWSSLNASFDATLKHFQPQFILRSHEVDPGGYEPDKNRGGQND
jgi:hypothetical protein